jgi:anti-sigma B factor antagonist
MTEASYRARRVGDQAVVTMAGEIDLTNAGDMRQALLAAVSDGPAALIIDMSGTTFCDSAGVQAIVDAYHQATANRTQIRLVATVILRILTLTGVDQLIPTYPSLEAALAGIPAAQTNAGDAQLAGERAGDRYQLADGELAGPGAGAQATRPCEVRSSGRMGGSA